MALDQYSIFNQYPKEIKKVAIYLRKSREEENVTDALAKHKLRMIPFVESRGWIYDLYEEIKSGDKLRERPVFMELLDLVEEGKYDAVVAVAVDRLTRGSQKDAGIIEEVFEESETLIITPDETIDLANEMGKQRFEMLTLFSRNEYRSIKGRLKNGKISGTHQGSWTNGSPMFPYVYDRNNKTIVISSEENKNTYLYIVHLFLDENIGTDAIALRLNTEKVPTITRIGTWRQSQVLRLLTGGVHAGYVYYGKHRRTKDNRVLTNDSSKVIFKKGSHEAIITEEQYQRILRKIESSRKIPVAARNSTYIFSGLLRCGLCGKSMITYTQVRQPSYLSPKTKEFLYIRNCSKMKSDGVTKCNNRTCPEDVLIHIVNDRLNLLFDDLSQKPKKQVVTESVDLLSLHQETMKRAKAKIERIQESYWDGEINKTRYLESKAIEEQKIVQAQQHIELIKKSNEYLSENQEADRTERWTKYYKKDMLLSPELSVQDKNKSLLMLVEKIKYTRIKNDINVEVIMK